MDITTLPTNTTINGKRCEFNSDYRDILNIFQVFNDPDLLDEEKIIVALALFYKTDDYSQNVPTALNEMMIFINGGQVVEEKQNNHSQLYDWQQDFNLIIAPVNKILGQDVRGIKYLHWWTFLSAFLEMGECRLNTYMSIRDKLNRGIKLDKWEERIYKDNKSSIQLKKKYDSTTQAILDDILGR